MGTLEQLLKVVVSDHEGDRETDGGPEGVATADPVPEGEDVGLGDAKGGDGLCVRAECDKVLCDVSLVLCGREEPVPRALRVGNGLLGSECLTSDDEQGGLGVRDTQSLGQVRSVDVGDEVSCQITLGVRLEGLSDHDGSEIRTTDTDVDDGVDSLASVSLPGTAAYLL